MKSFPGHILSLGRVLAVITFLANSGFTTILHNCTMVSMSCCDAPSETNHKDCGESLPADSAPSIQSNSVCHTNTVVGGVTTNPAVFEKNGKSDLKKSVLEVTLLVSPTTLSQDFASSSFPAVTTPVFLPSVEKYVLNSTFLI